MLKRYTNDQYCSHSLKTILEKGEMLPFLIENIRDQINASQCDPDLIFSFRDCIKGKKIHKQSFLIQLYVDDIGVTNPIGPKKGQHKLTMVYFMLEDVPDPFRSMLQCIHLAAICYSKYLDNDEKIRKFYGLFP